MFSFHSFVEMIDSLFRGSSFFTLHRRLGCFEFSMPKCFVPPSSIFSDVSYPPNFPKSRTRFCFVPPLFPKKGKMFRTLAEKQWIASYSHILEQYVSYAHCAKRNVWYSHFHREICFVHSLSRNKCFVLSFCWKKMFHTLTMQHVISDKINRVKKTRSLRNKKKRKKD